MGLENRSGNLKYVNIKTGKFAVKNKAGQIDLFDSISGVITGMEFATDTYENKTFEVAKINIVDGADEFQLKMRVDSGYFRGFVNSLKSGKPTERVVISPNYSEKDGKKQYTCFVSQHGKALKWAHTFNNPGDMPPLKKVSFKGEEHWDNEDQLAYWKNWVKGIQFTHAAVAQSDISSTDVVTKGQKDAIENLEPIDNFTSDEVSDLPF